MPRLRKPQPVLLSDDELYALMRATFKHPKVPKWNPQGYEQELLQNAHEKIATEYYARAEEQQRIDAELDLIAKDYEG